MVAFLESAKKHRKENENFLKHLKISMLNILLSVFYIFKW